MAEEPPQDATVSPKTVVGKATADFGGGPPPRITAEEQRQHAIQWLERHWKGDRVCPICQANDEQWSTSDVVRISVPRQPGVEPRFPDPGALYAFSVACKTCGYMRFFNGFIAEIVSPNLLLKTDES